MAGGQPVSRIRVVIERSLDRPEPLSLQLFEAR
jgi:hypothetical protein